MHTNRIKNNNDNNKDIYNKINKTRPVVICDNIKNTHKKLINKVHTENNSANTITKETHIKVLNNMHKQVISIDNTHIDYGKHKKLFNNVLKQIKQVNKVHTKTSNTFIDLDKCKKAHKKLFINVHNQLKSNIMLICKKGQDIKTHLQILLMKCIPMILIMMYYYIIIYYITLVK